MCDFTSLFRRYHHYSVWFRSSAGMRWFFHLAFSLFPSPSEHEAETCNHVNTRQQCLSKCGLNFEKLWCYTTCVTQKLTNCITVECWLNVLASTNETHCTSNCLIFCQPFCYLFFFETKVYLLHLLLSPFHLREQSFFLSFLLSLSLSASPWPHSSLTSLFPFITSSLSLLSSVFPSFLSVPPCSFISLRSFFSVLISLSQHIPLPLSNIHQLCLPVWIHTYTHPFLSNIIYIMNTNVAHVAVPSRSAA